MAVFNPDIRNKNITPFQISEQYAFNTFSYSEFVTIIYDKNEFSFNVNSNSSEYNASDYTSIPWCYLIGLRGLYNCLYRPNGIVYIRNNELDVVFKIHICF